MQGHTLKKIGSKIPKSNLKYRVAEEVWWSQCLFIKQIQAEEPFNALPTHQINILDKGSRKKGVFLKEGEGKGCAIK